MERRRAIALWIGGIVTLITFVVIMGIFAFGNVAPQHDRITVTSIALGPVAMIAVMVGYAVWWMVMFLLTYFGVDEKESDKPDLIHPSGK